jgi:hypothetical protein
MRGVINTTDPLKSILVRQMADIPEDHVAGLASISSEEQGVKLVREIRVPDGSRQVQVLGSYRYHETSPHINLSGGNNISVLGGGTLHHEVGHHVHERRITNSADAEWRTISSNGQNARITAYARTSRGEHFAEAYSYYARPGRTRAKLKALEPKSYAYMQKLFRNNSKLLNANKEMGPIDSSRWGD